MLDCTLNDNSVVNQFAESKLNLFFFSERLQELKEKEKEADFFTKMPSKHYMEVASLLLNRYVLIKHGKMV